MKAWMFVLVFLGGVVMGFAQEVKGREILQKADGALYPNEGSFELSIESREKGSANPRRYSMQGYKRGKKYQTLVWKSPAVNFNDVGMRSGDVIYYKPAKWHKPQIMSYLAIFMDTGFSWGDVMVSDIAEDYRATRLEEITTNGVKMWYMVLAPQKEGMYARIDVWIDSVRYLPWQRVYYTAGGDILKTANYRDFEFQDGRLVGFTVVMRDYFTETESTAVVSKIKSEKVPDFLFTPQEMGRIRVR